MLPNLADDLRACLHFWSRLPVAPSAHAPDLSRAVRVLPLAGLLICGPAVLVLIVAREVLSLPALICAGLVIGTLVATTGALHEDGLADSADGLFGGNTPDRRLIIMRDSRIGTFGAIALVLSLLLRTTALAALIDLSPALALGALLAGAAVSRTAGLLPILRLPPARSDGLGAGVASFDRDAVRQASIVAAITLLLPLAAGASVSRVAVATVVATAAAYALVRLARLKIGGQTGDIAGAAQQVSEIGFLVVMSGATGA